jgi:hypothetical protein
VGSTGNVIRYAEIKNASFGVLLFNPENRPARPDVTLSNTVIQNISGNNLSFNNGNGFSGGGVLSYSGKVDATNCLFANCGEYAVLGVGGGEFDFNFCTIANYTPSFRRETASLTFTNKQASNPAVKVPLRLTFRNSILWGSKEDELFLENNADYVGALNIRNSVLRTKEYQATADAAGTPGLAQPGYNNAVNVNPRFKRTPESVASRYDYSLDAMSPASDRARATAPFPVRDLLNLPRNPTTPDAGAYERATP